MWHHEQELCVTTENKYITAQLKLMFIVSGKTKKNKEKMVIKSLNTNRVIVSRVCFSYAGLQH